MRLLALRITLGIIAAFQLAFGSLFLVAPLFYGDLIGLPEAPAWVAWIFGLFGARALAFVVGMVLAIRDPQRYRSWIVAMIVVQVLDGIVTLGLVAQGVLTFAQVSTAGFMPIVFVVALALLFPRRGVGAVPSASA
ncbi:MAG: hypothetical protein KF761_04730 [Salinibacterium sp.]|nr:hypothetical protein [Salinibacterium sp.]